MNNFCRQIISFVIIYALVYPGGVGYAQSNAPVKTSELTVRQVAVSDQLHTQTISTQRHQQFTEAVHKETDKLVADKQTITDYLTCQKEALARESAKTGKSKKTTSKKQTDTCKFGSGKSYKELVDELNNLIIIGLSKESTYSTTHHTQLKGTAADNDVYRLTVLQDNIVQGTISKEDYGRAVDVLYNKLYEPCKNQECEIRGAAILTLAIAGKEAGKYGKDTAFKNKIVRRISGSSKQDYGGLESDKVIGEHAMIALSILPSPTGQRTIVNNYVDKYGKKRRYEPTNPKDAFLIHLTELAVQYPYFNKKMNYTTPHLIAEWSNSDNFLLQLRGSIEVGRLPQRNEYFTAATLENIKTYLKTKYCNVGNAFGANVNGSAEDKMLARRDIALGYYGGSAPKDTLRAAGDNSCQVIWQREPYQREIIDDLSNKVMKEAILFAIPPGCALAGVAKVVKTAIKAVKVANKTGKPLREVYKTAKTVKKGQQAATKGVQSSKTAAPTATATPAPAAAAPQTVTTRRIGFQVPGADNTITHTVGTVHTAPMPAAPAGTQTTRVAAQAGHTPTAAAHGTTPTNMAAGAGNAGHGTPAPLTQTGTAGTSAARNPIGFRPQGGANPAPSFAVTNPAGVKIQATGAKSVQEAQEMQRLLDEAWTKRTETRRALEQSQRKLEELQAKQNGRWNIFGKNKRQEQIQDLKRTIVQEEREYQRAIEDFRRTQDAIGYGKPLSDVRGDIVVVPQGTAAARKAGQASTAVSTSAPISTPTPARTTPARTAPSTPAALTPRGAQSAPVASKTSAQRAEEAFAQGHDYYFDRETGKMFENPAHAKKMRELQAQRDAEKAAAAKRAEEEAATAKRAEETRKAEEARKAEELRKAKEAEEARKAEELRKAKEAEEARQAEELRKAKEAEEARQAEELRKAKQAEDAEEQARWDEYLRKSADSQRQAELAAERANKVRQRERRIAKTREDLEGTRNYVTQHQAQYTQLEEFRRGYKGHFKKGELSWQDTFSDAEKWVQETRKAEEETRKALSSVEGRRSYINEGLANYSHDVAKREDQLRSAQRALDKAVKSKDEKAISAARKQYQQATGRYKHDRDRLSYYKRLDKGYPDELSKAEKAWEKSKQEVTEAKKMLETIGDNKAKALTFQGKQNRISRLEETLSAQEQELERFLQQTTSN